MSTDEKAETKPAVRTYAPGTDDEGTGPDATSMVFVGTGVSTAIPVIGHTKGDCACADAIANPTGPNRRNNVSLLVRYKGCNVLIDAGKTFRDAYFRTMLPRRIKRFHAVLLTHDHADAVFGVDDLRDLQVFRHEGLSWVCETPVPVYLTERTLSTLSKGFDYVINNSKVIGPAHEPVHEPVAEVPIERRVACLRLRIVDDSGIRPVCFEPGVLDGLPFFSIPVFHGGDYRCLGFAFGAACAFPSGAEALEAPAPDRTKLEHASTSTGTCVLYLSDVSAIPDDVMAALERMSAIDVLVVDMLLPDEKHFSHYSIDDAWELIVRLQPRVAYGTGMYCKIEHHATNAALRERLDAYRAALPDGSVSRIERVELAFDGLELDF
uniref:Metallo-beta-lactamase domain-containing protein n=1 Tax=Neobodo designis TaxID=312471 RepID=A0A6U4U425_NEODS|mmetsp:Transcript_39328/g.121617  ORF Transcript_39328/g.121617 Transcript_39328/m.121617 type:complete len:380 (+) Transcript_39328:33-1172(+)